jgi:hypothetical protein
VLQTTIKLTVLAVATGGTTYALMHWKETGVLFKILVHALLVLGIIISIPEAIVGAQKGLQIALIVLAFVAMMPTGLLWFLILTTAALALALKSLLVWNEGCKCRKCYSRTSDKCGIYAGFALVTFVPALFILATITK